MQINRFIHAAGVSPAFTLLCSLATACGVPTSIKLYAADLPSRADGQYALLDESVKKQLVLKDSELQCAIDGDAASAACKCSTSAGDWLADCKAWLGSHTPTAAEPPAAKTATDSSIPK